MLVGIDDIGFHTSEYYLPLSILAQHKREDPNKYYIGFDQYQMGVLPLDEDIVTMGANAAWPLIKNRVDRIKTIIFATESGIDQSKSAGIYVHRLLGLPANIRVVEVKQACYSATAALQMACSMVVCDPASEVLIIASDVSRYGINTPGEATQGCGAVAMCITANPNLLAINIPSGCYCNDVMDFWRPNYMNTAIVDGRYSMQIYLKALENCWGNYLLAGGIPYAQLSRFCYHLPFGKMGEKAHKKLVLINNETMSNGQLRKILNSSLLYNRYIGNTYTASLYISLISLIENDECNLDNYHVGCFSYGSGCMGEFFSMTVQPGYHQYSHKNKHLSILENRKPLDYCDYVNLFNHQWPVDGQETLLPKQTSGRFRLAAICNHQRIYSHNNSDF